MKYIIFDCDGTLVDTSQKNYPLFSGVRELLEDLAPDFKLYVWTARDRASTQRILKENQVLSFFEEMFTASDGFIKPHPEGLERLVGGQDKSEIWVIGDSLSDIFGAKNFGSLAIGAIWSPEVRVRDLELAGADFLVNDPRDCSKIIREN
jgi:phosphoglycolate phosphatase